MKRFMRIIPKGAAAALLLLPGSMALASPSLAEREWSWNWNSDERAWVSPEQEALVSPDGTIATTVEWENGLAIRVWSIRDQTLLTTVSNWKGLREWMTREGIDWKSNAEWRSWIRQTGWNANAVAAAWNW